jgi:hypothetical protein
MWSFEPIEGSALIFKISRDALPFRASPNDMVQHLIKKWREFEERVYQLTPEVTKA